MCIELMSFLFRTWNADAGDIYHLYYDELQSITFVLRYLLIQHPRKCIQEWIMPLLQRNLLFKVKKIQLVFFFIFV